MAFSPESRHRSRFTRGMSQDPNNTNHSCASSTGSHHGTVSDSTFSDFDPENEAIMSTRQMNVDFSQKLPELRDTAKKYGRWNGNRLPDFNINTSAIGRAFPDFSQGDSSDDSIHLEVARGAKTRQHILGPQFSNSIDSPIVTIGDFQILSTPPTKSQPKSLQQQDAPRSNGRKDSQSKRVSVQKENIPPPEISTSAKKMQSYVSGATRTSSGEQRRTLAEIHAQVADDSEGSFIGKEPATTNLAAKASRFASFQPKKSPLVNVSGQNKQKITDALVDALANHRDTVHAETPSKPPSNSNTTSNTFNPTNQSFLLPNMPEISELVSGNFKDGTPVFMRNGKAQSRFSSGGGKWARDHNELAGIIVPQDEKDIFLSLQLLQDKVDALEMEKADNQRAFEELQNQNYYLQANIEELQKRHRSDSALGMVDSGSDGEYARDNQKLVAEKTKLEAHLKSLQNLLDTSDRSISNLEHRLKTNTGERDQAVKQLAEAWHNSEELKAQNESLRQENEYLKQQLSVRNRSLRKENETLRKQLLSGNEALREEHEALRVNSKAQNELLKQEAKSLMEQLAQLASDRAGVARDWQQKENSLKRKLQRRETALQNMREMTCEINETEEIQVCTSKVKATDCEIPKSRKGKRVGVASDIEQPVYAKVQMQEPIQPLRSSNVQIADRGRSSLVAVSATSHEHSAIRVKARSRSRSRAMSTNEPLIADKSKLRAMLLDYEHDAQFDDTTEDGSFDDATKTIHKDINVNGAAEDHDRTQDSNFSSIFGHGEMDRMREMVANIKAKQQERRAAASSANNAEDETVQSALITQPNLAENHPVQRKSSKNGLTGILKNPAAQDQDDVTECLSVKSCDYHAAPRICTAQSTTKHERRHSETSIRGHTKRREHIIVEDMTSAFILPDITIHGNAHGAEHKVLSASARKVLDNLAQHDGPNCTVCSRVASFETENASVKIDTKKTVRVEKLVPVSDRMPVAGPYEDEPTMRPLNSPGLALATVMKGLQDELAHLKMELAQYQSMYNRYDMSLGMRKRKAIKAKIEKLLKAIDTKADQIYGLYDVLEGQKQSGQELSEDEVEITLQSVGVDVNTLKQNNVHDEENQSEDGSGNESDLDLPWEGIEDTTGNASLKERRQSWHL